MLYCVMLTYSTGEVKRFYLECGWEDNPIDKIKRVISVPTSALISAERVEYEKPKGDEEIDVETD